MHPTEKIKLIVKKEPCIYHPLHPATLYPPFLKNRYSIIHQRRHWWML
jgi:hypothetical protein